MLCSSDRNLGVFMYPLYPSNNSWWKLKPMCLSACKLQRDRFYLLKKWRLILVIYLIWSTVKYLIARPLVTSLVLSRLNYWLHFHSLRRCSLVVDWTLNTVAPRLSYGYELLIRRLNYNNVNENWPLATLLLTDEPYHIALAHIHAYWDKPVVAWPCFFVSNGKALWGCVDRTVSFNTRDFVYSLSGRSICLLERGQFPRQRSNGRIQKDFGALKHKMGPKSATNNKRMQRN